MSQTPEQWYAWLRQKLGDPSGQRYTNTVSLLQNVVDELRAVYLLPLPNDVLLGVGTQSPPQSVPATGVISFGTTRVLRVLSAWIGSQPINRILGESEAFEPMICATAPAVGSPVLRVRGGSLVLSPRGAFTGTTLTFACIYIGDPPSETSVPDILVNAVATGAASRAAGDAQEWELASRLRELAEMELSRLIQPFAVKA